MRPSRKRPAAGRAWSTALLALAFASISLLLPGSAWAWVELHVARDDVRVAVEPGGQATVEHRVVLLVSGGPLRGLVMRGVDDDAEVDASSYVVLKKDSDRGALDSALPLRVERVRGADGEAPSTDLKIEIDGGKGVGRGTYLLFLRYRTDLAGRGLLVPDGSTATLRWTGPAWDDGLETTRAVFELPASASVPRVLEAADSEEADLETALSSLTRKPGVDALEILRPYAPRGERVEWKLRVDRSVLGPRHDRSDTTSGGAEASTARSSAFELPQLGDARSSTGLALALAVFAVIVLLVVARELELARRAEDSGLELRALVPMPLWLRAVSTAVALLGGVALQLELAASLPGAVAIAVATLLVWRLPARPKKQLRGPGSWLAVRSSEVFERAPSTQNSYFDPSTRSGKACLALLCVIVAGAAASAARLAPYYAVFAALDALPLYALFLSGQGRALAPDLAVSPVPFLDAVQRELSRRAGEGLRLVPRLRLPRGSADADELRLTVLPKRPLPGMVSIEVAVAPELGPGGWILLPELLVRVRVGSPSHTAAEALGIHGRSSPGRKSDELMLAFAPKLPTARLTAELCGALLRSFSVAESAPGSGLRAAPEPGPGTSPSKRRAPARAKATPVRELEPRAARAS